MNLAERAKAATKAEITMGVQMASATKQKICPDFFLSSFQEIGTAISSALSSIIGSFELFPIGLSGYFVRCISW